MTLGDVVGDRVELRGLALVDEVGTVAADHRTVGGDRDDLEPVRVCELPCFGGGGARHARELVVHAEVVLERHGREGLVLFLDPHPLFGLDRLVQALAPTAALQDAAGELVDDLHLALLHHIVDVALEQLLRAQRGLDLVDEVLVHVLVEVVDVEGFLDPGNTLFGGYDGLFRLVDLVVAVALEVFHDRGELVVELLGVVGTTRDDERRAGLVDEDEVDLVDDGVLVTALELVVLRDGHVVAEVVEPELVVGAVGDVGRVGQTLRFAVFDLRQDDSDFEAEVPVDPPHPLRVALGEVVVRGDEVHTLAEQRVQVERERGDERLALAGLHLGDPPEMQRRAAHHLHVEVPLADRAHGGLAGCREGFGEEVVEEIHLRVVVARLVEALAEVAR